MITKRPAQNFKNSFRQILEKKLCDKTNEASMDHSSTQIFSEISSNIKPFLSPVPINRTNPLSQLMLQKFNTLKSPDQKFKEIFKDIFKIQP